jgi:hypothetical protein
MYFVHVDEENNLPDKAMYLYVTVVLLLCNSLVKVDFESCL